jgi:capsular polysaccharide biosynthesis protein
MTTQEVEYIYYRPYPENIKEDDKYLFKHLLERKIIIAVKNRILKNAYVNYDGHIWKGLNIINDVSFRLRKNTISNYYIELKHIIKQHFLKKTIHIDQACWIIDDWSCNYGHFLIDVMQRYIQLRIKHSSNLCVLLPDSYRNYGYLTETLNTLNIKIIFIKENQLIKVKQLFIPDFYFPPGIINNNIIGHVREVFWKLGNPANINSGPKRIFITRNKDRKRKIINENELYPLLEKYDFNITYLADLTIVKQMELCCNAEIIVGLHGAGLTNIMFMKKGKVIELRMKGAIDQWSFFELATALEHKYYYLLCDPATSNTDPYEGDVVVNTSDFVKLISSTINN